MAWDEVECAAQTLNMKTIHKYPLNAYPTQHYIPQDAEFLCVQTQNNEPMMWFLVDTTKAKVQRNFALVGTGFKIDFVNGEYRGTFQLDQGTLVFHVFELL